MNKNRFDCLGIGLATWDEFFLLKNFPQKDSKNDLKDHFETSGGPVLNALRFLSAMNKNVYFGGHCGDDFRGRLIEKEIVNEGISVSPDFCLYEEETSFAHIWVEKMTGSRTLCSFDTDNFHLSSTTQNNLLMSNSLLIDNRHAKEKIPLLKTARNTGMIICCDFGSPRPSSLDMIPFIDDAIVSEKFVKGTFPDFTIKESMIRLSELGAGVVVVTRGESGCLVFEKSKKVLEKNVPFLQNVVDTTGAGDIFHGAWIFARLNDWDLNKCLDFAIASAALQCTFPGTRVDMFTLSNIEKFMTLESD